MIWPTPPILFFPRLVFQFTTRTGTSEAAGTRGWDLPFWRQPTHQVGWEQSRNHVINNAGKSLPTDTVIQTKSCLAPATFFHLKNELRWLSSAQQRREISPNLSAEKLHSSLRCGSPDFAKATPNNTSRISFHWCFNTDFYSSPFFFFFKYLTLFLPLRTLLKISLSLWLFLFNASSLPTREVWLPAATAPSAILLAHLKEVRC